MATSKMSPEATGWYLKLILYQFEDKYLPKDVEELAALCGVKYSDFKKFTKTWNTELKSKFVECEKGIKNLVADEILEGRERFKDKRSAAGKMSSIIKKARLLHNNNSWIAYVKTKIDLNKVETSDSTSVEQMLGDMLQLFINQIKSNNINSNKEVKGNRDIFLEDGETAEESKPSRAQELLIKLNEITGKSYSLENINSLRSAHELLQKYEFSKVVEVLEFKNQQPKFEIFMKPSFVFNLSRFDELINELPNGSEKSFEELLEAATDE